MEYTVQSDEPVSDGIKRIIRGKVETGIDHIDGDMDRHETVHEVRKRCKEVRAALRLVRGVLPTYSEANAHYRDAARELSDIRDATALIETFDEHIETAVVEAGKRDDIDLPACRNVLIQRREYPKPRSRLPVKGLNRSWEIWDLTQRQAFGHRISKWFSPTMVNECVGIYLSILHIATVFQIDALGTM